MRRLVPTFALLAALALPAAALAAPAALTAKTAAGDGTFVLQNGQAPNGVAVVKMTITGSVIGQVQGFGKIIIDAGPNGPTPQVSGAGNPRAVPGDKDGSALQWGFTDSFKFRAVGGTFTIVIYGGDVDLVAIGKSKNLVVTGMPDMGKGDGRYSLNGADWKSLPGTPSDPIAIASNG